MRSLLASDSWRRKHVNWDTEDEQDFSRKREECTGVRGQGFPDSMLKARFYFFLICCRPVLLQNTLNMSSVQFSHSVVSDSLGPHGLQHTRLPYPSPTPRAY